MRKAAENAGEVPWSGARSLEGKGTDVDGPVSVSLRAVPPAEVVDELAVLPDRGSEIKH